MSERERGRMGEGKGREARGMEGREGRGREGEGEREIESTRALTTSITRGFSTDLVNF